MKRKRILIIAVATCLLFAVGILLLLEVGRSEATLKEQSAKTKESQKPSWERFEEEVKAEEAAEAEREYTFKKKDIITKKNCIIDGKKYEKVMYAKRRGVVTVFFAKMKGERLVYPSEIDGIQVTKIGDLDYGVARELGLTKKWNKKFKEMVIPEGVTHIGEDAFWGMNAEKVIFPSTLQKLGMVFTDGKVNEVIVKSKVVELEHDAFGWLKTLKRVSFPEDYEGKFSDGAFFYSGIKEIHWPKGGNVEEGAFDYCKNLEKVVFPENQEVIRIPERAFTGCNKLKELVFPASTGKVIIENNVSAENTLTNSMPPVLRFEGKDTKLQGLEKKVNGKNLVMTQKIIAPKGSEAIRYAKESYRLKKISNKKSIRKDIDDTLANQDVPEWWDEYMRKWKGVRFAPLRYEEVG